MEKIKKFTEEAILNLQEEERDMKIAMLEIQQKFRELLLEQNVMTSGRVKSPESLREKILRKSYHVEFEGGKDLIGKLDDVIGVRIICLLHSNEEEVWNNISKSFKEQIIDGVEYFVNDNGLWLKKTILPVPQKNGHDIYKIHGFYEKDKTKYNFELQIKSLVHMLWGEIEHMLFYKNYDYIVDNIFYNHVMEALFKSLIGIDTQLESITKQMLGKNDELMFSELKRMLAKILYEKVNPAVECLFGCKIDLRDCYDSVIELTLHKYYIFDYKECLNKVQEVTKQINNIRVEKIESTIPIYSYSKSALDHKRKAEISEIISKKIQLDVNWQLFAFLAGELCSISGQKNIIESISDYFLKLYSYEDELNEVDDEKKYFVMSVSDDYLFKIIRRFDYYWLISNKSFINDMILFAMNLISDTIIIDKYDDIKKPSTLLCNLLFLKTCIHFDKNIKVEVLEEILEVSNNDIWAPEIFKSHEFKKLISNFGNNEEESYNRLKEIIRSDEVGL